VLRMLKASSRMCLRLGASPGYWGSRGGRSSSYLLGIFATLGAAGGEEEFVALWPRVAVAGLQAFPLRQ